MENIIIRQLKSSDFVGIYKLNCDLGYEYPIEKTEQRISYVLKNTTDIVLVAELHCEIVGYIHASPYEPLYFDSLLDILGFSVKEEARGVGIGHSLIIQLENLAKERGTFKGIRLVSSHHRTLAHKFYEMHGFEYRKDQKNFIKLFTKS